MRIIYKEEKDRWIKGDRFVRPAIRKLIRKSSPRQSGMQKVVANFLIGLSRSGVKYNFNKSFSFTNRSTDKIISFGLGKQGLEGVKKSNPLIAAIGFPYPLDLPELCDNYNTKKYLQHSSWVLDFAKSANLYKEEIYGLWPAGIDTVNWIPAKKLEKKQIDVLIYNKVYWEVEHFNNILVQPIRDFLSLNKFSFTEIIYGQYNNEEYIAKLNESKVMIFLSAHESQGLAYQECLSCDIPVIAWDQGFWLDPIRFKYGKPIVKASSVPYFDERCGMKFVDFEEFTKRFMNFFENSMSLL